MHSFPQEVKDHPQWAICGFKPGTSQEKQPYIWDNESGQCVPLCKDGTAQRPSNLHMLMSFDDAYACVQYHNKYGHNLYVGFYLLPEDPFCCIDMDMKPDWSEEQRQSAEARYRSIISTFHTYTEISKSGWGVHLWLYGDSVQGKRRDGIEIYSQYRFIICTGTHLEGAPFEMSGMKGSPSELYIASWLERLRSEMGDIGGMEDFQMVELTQQEWEADPKRKTLLEIYNQGCAAVNGDLFKQLIEGRWEQHDVAVGVGERAYQSASEAEYALIDMLCFYTPYNFQVREIFYGCPFGDRYFANRRKAGDKVKVEYHFNQMLLKRRRDEARSDQEAQHQAMINMRSALEREERILAATTPSPAPIDYLTTAGTYHQEADSGAGIDWPPGAVGELARYMMRRSLRPLKDVAILTALSLMSGIVGKAWNTHTRGGLNNYFILVAKSGTGKDSFKSNMVDIMQQVALRGGHDGTQLFGADNIVNTAEYSSRQALRKNVTVTGPTADGETGQGNGLLSFIHYVEEVGGFLSGVASGIGQAPGLANEMLKLYNESRFDAITAGQKYSNKDHDGAGGRVAAYSFAGETTQEKFFSCINMDMMSGGFMSRMIVWDCDLVRPSENKMVEWDVPQNICSWLGTLVMQASTIYGGTEPCVVQLDSETEEMYDRLDDETNKKLNGDGVNQQEENEAIRQLHSRRAFKVLKIACVLAVGDNHLAPVVTKVHYEWARKFVDTSIEAFTRRYKKGEIGSENFTMGELRIIDYCLSVFDQGKYSNEMKKPQFAYFKRYCIISKNDIKMQVARSRAFRGGQKSFDGALVGLAESGTLAFISKQQIEKLELLPGELPFKGHAYILDLDRMRSIRDEIVGKN